MRGSIGYLLAFALLLCTVTAAAQHRVRIAGLENDAEYRALMAEEERLTRASDSMTRAMNEVRQAFRTDTENRGALTAAILRMEEEMFEMRNRMARVTGQVNAMEQEWILKNLNGEHSLIAAEDPDKVAAPDETVANLVYNAWFGRNLGPSELSDLRRAQHSEAGVGPLVETYRANHDRLGMLKHAYDAAPSAGIADSIKNRFDSLARVNRSVDNEIADTWGAIFDDKSYAYNLLMDKENRHDLLQVYESGLDKARAQQAELQGLYASDAPATYYIQKNLLTQYELTLASELGLDKAADSLRRVLAGLPDPAKLRGLDPVAIRERLFLDFSDITIHSSSQYSSSKPIPQVTVYPKGVIYRVLLGAWSTAQPPSVFRNVAPIAVQKGPDGKFRYFAGGFASREEVDAAARRMTSHGFRKPEPVVWMDGVYVHLATGTGFADSLYRIEMEGAGELSPQIREVIRTVTGGREILRTGEGFIVGPLDDALEAAKLRTALDGVDPAMDVRMTEIIR